MSEITRICAQCGQPGPLEARHCPHCGHDAEAGVPAQLSQRNLPVLIGRAALPLLAGAASLALRAGWHLLQKRLAQPLTAPSQPPVKTATVPEEKRPRRTIRIRSAWAVGDARGVWRQGSSEHTIEIDD
jgi:hypothetical protein